MSALLATSQAALLADGAALRRQARDQLRNGTEPAALGTAALMTLAGSELEPSGYQILAPDQRMLGNRLLRAASSIIAKRIIGLYPAMVTEILASPVLRSQLQSGSMKRLSPESRAARALFVLISDTEMFFSLERRGMLDWDGGDVQASLAILYGWQLVLGRKRGVFESSVHTRINTPAVLAAARKKWPDNQICKLVEFWFDAAWRPGRARPAARLSELAQLAEQPQHDDRNVAIRMMALRAQVDVGVRFQQPVLARTALDALRPLAAPQGVDVPNLQLLRAFAEARGGDPQEARRLVGLVHGAERQGLAAQILSAAGDPQGARALLSGLAANLRPSPHPRAAVGREFL